MFLEKFMLKILCFFIDNTVLKEKGVSNKDQNSLQ